MTLTIIILGVWLAINSIVDLIINRRLRKTIKLQESKLKIKSKVIKQLYESKATIRNQL